MASNAYCYSKACLFDKAGIIRNTVPNNTHGCRRI